MDLDRLSPQEVAKVGRIIDLLGTTDARLDLERHIAVLEATRDVYIARLKWVHEHGGRWEE